MTIKFLVIALNVINFLMLFGIPIGIRVQLWYWLHKYNGQITFESTILCDIFSFSTSSILERDFNQIECIKCTVPISKNRYLHWTITENGEIIVDPFKVSSGWKKEKLLLREKNLETDDNEDDNYAYIGIHHDKFCRSYSLGIFTRWLLRRYSDQHYIMAKMGGL